MIHKPQSAPSCPDGAKTPHTWRYCNKCMLKSGLSKMKFVSMKTEHEEGIDASAGVVG